MSEVKESAPKHTPGVHPDLTARRAVDACGGTFPKARNDYDDGWARGHEAALDAAMEAVAAADALTADLLEALVLILPLAKGYRPEGQTDTARRTCNSWIEAAEEAIAKATGSDQ